MKRFSDFVAAPKHKAAVEQQAPAAPAQLAEPPATIKVPDEIVVTIAALNAAIQRFNARVVAAHAAGRSDLRAERNLDACASLAAALRRYGRLTEKQLSYAKALIGWSQDDAAAKPAAQQATPRPATWAALQPFAKLLAGRLEFRKKNGQSLWWVVFDGALVGKAEDGAVTGFGAKIRAAGIEVADLRAALDAFEGDPTGALRAHGLATGSCGCCGLELTDPVSVERGIGPICWTKGGF
jgi:hypothetical protein